MTPHEALHGYFTYHRFITEDELDEILTFTDGFMPEQWQPGRQGGGYEKIPFDGFCPRQVQERAWWMLGREVLPGEEEDRDCWLIRYPKEVGIPLHRDHFSDKKHKRLNVVLRQPQWGGNVYIEGRNVMLGERDALVFRPDLCKHEVTPGVSERLVLSFGISVP